jgi:hypothetical protein
MSCHPSQSTVIFDSLLHNFWPLAWEPKEEVSQANNGEQSSALNGAPTGVGWMVCGEAYSL